jgi:hypothetical protein
MICHSGRSSAASGASVGYRGIFFKKLEAFLMDLVSLLGDAPEPGGFKVLHFGRTPSI